MSECEASKSASGNESEDESYFEYHFNTIEPYENDPEASDDGSSSDDSYEDEDRIPRAELEKRYEGTLNVKSWCKCGNCRTENLVGAREFRCCKELSPVLAKLGFEGLEIKCIREHEDYDPLTHRAVLLNVGPLFRGKDGKKYKRRGKSQGSENEFCRAVAYRWLVRWLCGSIGWENARPLSACIYDNIRTTFPTGESRGFKRSEEQ